MGGAGAGISGTQAVGGGAGAVGAGRGKGAPVCSPCRVLIEDPCLLSVCLIEDPCLLSVCLCLQPLGAGGDAASGLRNVEARNGAPCTAYVAVHFLPCIFPVPAFACACSC